MDVALAIPAGAERFHHHASYTLPTNTRLLDVNCDYYFDNSAKNPRNPFQPPQDVYWGEQSKEEMAICNFLYTCDTLADLKLSHQHQLETRKKDRNPAPLPEKPLPAATP